ncbi:MAG: hypothetical protein GY862_27120 [Gammaproteobacteria bacterium]|nr:hypothetical protein [Gammaproteobacteria bacterium]MCP5013869.1 hypothetical protein [Ketobacter sp.]
MNAQAKTHYRKAFNSPYLGSADIVGPTVLTISRVSLEIDMTKKTKDYFNTAHFAERELRPGEPLKPMILNAGNSKTMKDLTGSHFIEDWVNVKVTIYVDPGVRFGRDTVEGLRISPQPPAISRPVITRDKAVMWENAKAAYLRDGNFDAVLARADISEADQQAIINECA